jgi:hypothetical protein
MPDAAERFIAAATATLGDNPEVQVAARQELEGALVPGDPAAWADDVRQLEDLAHPRKIARWRTILFIATAAVSLVSVALIAKSLASYRQSTRYLSSLGTGDETLDTRSLSRGLTADQKLLLLGDTSETLPSDRFKGLWNSDPTNPAYFAEYSIHSWFDHQRLPQGFLAAAERLDPDNAWFVMFAAGTVAENAVERSPLSMKERKSKVLPKLTVRDQKRSAEALALFQKATSLPRFESYQVELLKQRIPLLPRRTDFASQAIPMGYVAGLPSGNLKLRNVLSVVEAEAERMTSEGDAAGFSSLMNGWRKVLESGLQGSDRTLVDILVFKSLLTAPARRFQSCAERLALPEEASRWKDIATGDDERRARNEDRHFNRRDPLVWNGSLFAGLSLPVVSRMSDHAPPVREEDLQPGRLADHEGFCRVSSLAAWLVLGLMLGCAAVFPSRGSVLVQRLSRRLVDLLRPVDWAWILGAGMILPLLYYILIYRFTPLGARELSLRVSLFMVPAGQVTSMAFLMIATPLQIARWRLGKRGAMLGWQNKRPWVGWIAVICGALALPAFGLGFLGENGNPSMVMIAAALLGILVLVWLVFGIRAVFSKGTPLLRRVTLSRILVPAYALGMLLMAASMPFYHAAEKRWLAQDRLMEITPEAPALSRYEWQVAQAMRAELLEILNTK